MCYNRESMERVLKLLEMVYTDDLKGAYPLDMRIKNKGSLETFSKEFSKQ